MSDIKIKEVNDAESIKELKALFDKVKGTSENDSTLNSLFSLMQTMKLWVPVVKDCPIQSKGMTKEEKSKEAPFMSPDGIPFFPMLIKGKATPDGETAAFIPLFYSQETFMQYCRDAYAGVGLSLKEALQLANSMDVIEGIIVDPFEAGFHIPLSVIKQVLDSQEETK